jgi:Leucine-rich repeat (LRR) protein
VDLTNNNITSLPDSFPPNLTEFSANDNHISSIPPTLLVQCNRISNLSLSHNAITAIPAELGNATSLCMLALNNNAISKVPAAIGNLCNLTHLCISHNTISEIPATIGNLCSLTQFSINDNTISEIPEEIGNLHNLVSVSLNNNQFMYLPETLWNLRNIQLLDISSNKLHRLSIGIGKLTNLSHLNIARNPDIKAIPSSICNTRLNILCILETGLTVLPATLRLSYNKGVYQFRNVVTPELYWHPRYHKRFPLDATIAIRALMLCNYRCVLPHLPMEMIWAVLECLSLTDWLDR